MNTAGTVESAASGTNPPSISPKWAALVGDRLFPLPRRKLAASVILAQAGAPPGSVLVRDYNQPGDVAIPSTTIVDLAEGNVFRIVEACDAAATTVPHGSQPKLAFIADDAWEITVQPNQTLESLRELFDLPDDAEVFRDFESPNDQPIVAGMVVNFADGPVFITRIKRITVKVNRKDVTFTKRRVTGLEVKQTAIAQGVAIEIGFVLHRKLPTGEFGPAIDDAHVIVLRKCDEFRCVAPDDNS
jgi:hypothetical protein